MTGRRAIVVTTKNEGPFLLEWIAHHRRTGFDTIIVFANDCEDGSDRLLQALDAAGVIRYLDNSEVLEGMPADPQNRAYRRAFELEEVRGADWVMVLDADEFLNIHVGDHTLDALFAAVGEADVISGTWVVRGNSGIIPFSDDLVTAQFQRAAPKSLQVSFRHFGLKTMFRPGPVHRLGIHRPFLKGEFKRPDKPLRWLNGSGQDVTRFYREKGWAASPATKGYDLLQIDHYMIKSNELFLMKRYRGTANSVDKDRINFDYYVDFNSNHVVDDSLALRADALREDVARLMALSPAIAAAHADCVAFFRAKIAALVSGLADSDPTVHARLLDGGAVTAQVAADAAWLVEAEARAKAAAAVRMAARPATPQAPRAAAKPATPPKPAPKPAAGRTAVAPPLPLAADDAADDALDAPAGPVAEDAAPAWLADLRRTDHRRGFYHSEAEFAAHFVERDRDTLLISFDNLSNVRDASLARDGWGYAFYREEGWSHLGVMSFAANWYRDPAFFDWWQGLARSNLFDRFSRVILTGTSMGAYAATTFARSIPGSHVLAFSPQSTLSSDLVPWEKRFGSGRARDWTGPYRDAAEGLDGLGSVFVLYDPDFEPDQRHAERLQGPNVMHLKTWYASHKSALFLRRAELLKPTVRMAVEGELNELSFYRLYRGRRDLPWYVNGLADRALAAGHKQLLGHASNALARSGRVFLARSLRAKIGG